MRRITLKLLGKVDMKILEELKKRLGETFDGPVEVKPGANNLDHIYDPRRRQYLATVLLSAVFALQVERGEKVLGIAVS